MISDKLSVGPPQMTGEIDAFNVRFDQDKKIEGIQDKKSFSEILNKKDKEIRETSGGINRKMSERKIDKNPKKFAGDTEKEEKETQPTSNSMAFSQSSVKVEDFDKNPKVEEVSDSENSGITTSEIKTNAFGESMDPSVEASANEQSIMNPDVDSDVTHSMTMAAAAATAEVPVMDAALMAEASVLNQFQSDVMQALKQSQNEMKSMLKDGLANEPVATPELETNVDQGASVKSETATRFQDQLAVPGTAAALMNHSSAEQQAGDFSGQNSFQANLQANQLDRSNSDEAFKNEMTDSTEKSETISTKIDDTILGSNSNLHSLQNHQTLQSGAAGATVTAKALDSAAHSQNTNEIVKQAEFLVKEGGGTAKIRLTPEGMGSVDLQVTMNQGRVQVELNTNDPQAKKLIQESITDLRSSLASHNFNLDHVKINNMSATADLSNQNFNSQSDARSNMNQQFNQNSNWNQQFGRQEQHRGNGEAPAQNFVNSESRVATDVKAAPVHSQKLQRGYAGMKPGSSLNMVA